MFGREKRVLLRHYLEQGMTITALVERLGVSRRTLYHWIKTGQLDRDLDQEPVRYKPRPPVPRKIDPYKAIILSRLGEYPELSATRLFNEVRAAGYPGGYTQVKEYVRQVRPRPPQEPVIRFETPPGRQAQVDFAHFRLPWGRRYALLVVLSYSRQLWLRFYRRQDMRTLFAGLEEAFRFFGGVPHEILFDQMRSVIVEDRSAGRAFRHRAGGAVRPGVESGDRIARPYGVRVWIQCVTGRSPYGARALEPRGSAFDTGDRLGVRRVVQAARRVGSGAVVS